MLYLSKETYISLPADDSYKNVIILRKVIPLNNLNEIITTVSEIEIELRKNGSISLYCPSEKACQYLEDAHNSITFGGDINPIKLEMVFLNRQKVFFFNKFKLYLDFDEKTNFLKLDHCLFKLDKCEDIVNHICECILKSPREIIVSFKNIEEYRELLAITTKSGVDFLKKETIGDNQEQKAEEYKCIHEWSSSDNSSDTIQFIFKQEKQIDTTTHHNNNLSIDDQNSSSFIMNVSQKTKSIYDEKSARAEFCKPYKQTVFGKNADLSSYTDDASNDSSLISSVIESQNTEQKSKPMDLITKLSKRIGKIDPMPLHKAKELLKFEEFKCSDLFCISKTTQRNMLRFVIWHGEYGSTESIHFWKKFIKYVPQNCRVDVLRYRTNFKSAICREPELGVLLLEMGIPSYTDFISQCHRKLQNVKERILPMEKEYISILDDYLKKENTPQSVN